MMVATITEEKIMQPLDDVVQYTVQEFVKNGLLFTGLDVSNKVKEDLPFARHSEVSELVRNSFVSEMEPLGYAKTPINVVLRDGSVRTALLYHPLADSWDLDNKYDAQKRAQVTVKPVTTVVPATVSANGTVTIMSPATSVTVPVPAPAVVAPTPVDPAQAWSQMFNSTPSLFPLK
jgi:hypothetical protein